MNDEPAQASCVSKSHRALEERLAQRPELRARLHHLLDTLEQSVADGSDAHAAEERVIQELRQLGQEVLGRWAHEAQVSTTMLPLTGLGSDLSSKKRMGLWGGLVVIFLRT